MHASLGVSLLPGRSGERVPREASLSRWECGRVCLPISHGCSPTSLGGLHPPGIV
jgi:hypothetical protein